jgi:hypothetical protein
MTFTLVEICPGRIDTTSENGLDPDEPGRGRAAAVWLERGAVVDEVTVAEAPPLPVCALPPVVNAAAMTPVAPTTRTARTLRVVTTTS